MENIDYILHHVQIVMPAVFAFALKFEQNTVDHALRRKDWALRAPFPSLFDDNERTNKQQKTRNTKRFGGALPPHKHIHHLMCLLIYAALDWIPATVLMPHAATVDNLLIFTIFFLPFLKINKTKGI